MIRIQKDNGIFLPIPISVEEISHSCNEEIYKKFIDGVYSLYHIVCNGKIQPLINYMNNKIGLNSKQSVDFNYFKDGTLFVRITTKQNKENKNEKF